MSYYGRIEPVILASWLWFILSRSAAADLGSPADRGVERECDRAMAEVSRLSVTDALDRRIAIDRDFLERAAISIVRKRSDPAYPPP